MAQTTSERNLIVEQIVATVLGDDAAPDLHEQVGRCAEAYDEGTAQSFVRALVEHLAEHPDGLREHESLIVLGLAHPRALRKARVPLMQEGRRLAARLEQVGEADRAGQLLEVLATVDPSHRGVDKDLASIMRRTGNVDRLIERYLRRAEEAVGEGRRRDAVTWLREVLMLDRSRRDVARMIRDLQYQERDTKERRQRVVRWIGVALVLIGMGVGVVFRELHVARAYAGLAPAAAGDVASLRGRLAAVDALIAGNPLWLGMFEASRERAKLRAEIDRLEAAAATAAREQADRRSERLIRADSARTRGLLLLEQRDFQGAAEQFRHALEVAPRSWAPAERLRADLDAIEQFLARPRPPSQEPVR